MVEKMDGKVDDEDIQEVLHEATLIPDLNRQQWVKAIKWLTDDPKQLVIVKALPIHEKTDYVLTHLAEWNLVSNLLSTFPISTFKL